MSRAVRPLRVVVAGGHVDVELVGPARHAIGSVDAERLLLGHPHAQAVEDRQQIGQVG